LRVSLAQHLRYPCILLRSLGKRNWLSDVIAIWRRNASAAKE
jgi:hypothetical protein